MIITVAHQKGGTGKSTIATNLAVELKTSLLDLDKQHSSIIFNYKRAHAGLEPLDCYSIAESQCRFDGQRPVPEAKLDESKGTRKRIWSSTSAVSIHRSTGKPCSLAITF